MAAAPRLHSLLAGVPLLAFGAIFATLFLLSFSSFLGASAANIHLNTDSEGWHRGRATYFGASPELVETFERVRGAGSYGDLHYGSCGMYRKPQVSEMKDFFLMMMMKKKIKEKKKSKKRKKKLTIFFLHQKILRIDPLNPLDKQTPTTTRESKPSARKTSPSTRPTPPPPRTPTRISPDPAVDATRSGASPASSRRTTTTTKGR